MLNNNIFGFFLVVCFSSLREAIRKTHEIEIESEARLLGYNNTVCCDQRDYYLFDIWQK